jgi:pimeloyl-ACP methyl ester carboxylesterase
VLALLTSSCLSFHKGAMPGEPRDATFLEVEGTRVRYLDVGDGPPVVLIHGFASAIENWVTVIPALKGKHRVIAVDLKGFGWTDRPESDYSPQAQARLVKAVLDERGVGKVAVVAHSWGTSVAMAFALEYPDQVSRLVLYDAWLYESQLPSMFHLARADGLGELLFGAFYDQRPDERIAQAFYDKDAVPEALVEDIERALERPGTRAAALAAVRGMHYAEVEGSYGKVKVPTLLLWGREDIVTPVSVGERLLRQLPDARMTVYPRCGHFPMIEARESTRDLVSFLEGGK